MNHKIMSKEEFKVVGVSKHVSCKNGENFQIIPKYWDEIFRTGAFEILDKNKGELGVLGISCNFNNDLEEFDYIIAVEGDTIEGLDNFEVVNIPKQSFAMFESIGPIPHAIQAVILKIYAEWFPQTKYQQAEGPVLEVYLPGNQDSMDYKCEVWVPVKEE